MKVRLLDGSRRGRVFEVSADDGRRLIALGKAEEVVSTREEDIDIEDILTTREKT